MEYCVPNRVSSMRKIFRLWVRYGLAHSTRQCCPDGRFLSSARRPDNISTRTTPKLYTSLFVVKWPLEFKIERKEIKCEPFSSSKSNLHSEVPRKWLKVKETLSFFTDRRVVENYTDQPFPVTLIAFLIELLHSNNHSSPGFGGHECVLLNPPLKDRTKPTLSQHTVRTEVPCGSSQLMKCKATHIRRLQYLTLSPRSRRHGGCRNPAARAA
ncbi:hypothetical protein ACMD2_10692 [Ananas comosus]|uniref:Uncharacterized protein n=1 Tax=Ananas comosus TaxID=4615 RepID=A0A199VBP6_ANACO|nr:hypothetical protein ACMD2_10692 [Ananas comosus]